MKSIKNFEKLRLNTPLLNQLKGGMRQKTNGGWDVSIVRDNTIIYKTEKGDFNPFNNDGWRS
jgi:hypothetical protein